MQNAPVEQSPLKRARLARGWTQAATMRRFVDAVHRIGGTCPDGASLRRMFAYWESGQRAVTEPTYQRALVEVFGIAPAMLGFLNPADATVDEMASRLRLFTIDRELVSLVEAQTDALRQTDRRVGTAILRAQAITHVEQISQLLHSSVGGQREQLAGALAAAAALAGWLALDDGNLPLAWQMHETAKSAARESEDGNVLAHVTAQQATVLLDAQQPQKASDLAEYARASVGNNAPSVLRSWLDATTAECLAAQMQPVAAGQRMNTAERLIDAGDGGPAYLMMSTAHVSRWRGHCLARLGDPAAIDLLSSVEPAVTDSVRATIGLKTDLALALHSAGRTDEAIAGARDASGLAALHGSRRQRRRLSPLLGSLEGEEVKDPDERA